MTESSEEWVERLRGDSVRQLEAIQQMQDELARVHGDGEAAGGLVAVRVTPAGMPTRLHLDPEAMHLPADELAGHIMAAVADATVEAAERMQAVVGQVVPADELEAMMRGTASEGDRASVREQLDALRGEVR